MEGKDMFSALNPEIIERFKTAIELGRWPDGKLLTDTQKETCMHAIIVYEHENLDEKERTGYVPPKETSCASHDNTIEAVKWK